MLQLERAARVRLGAADLLGVELVVGDRVEALHADRHLAVGDTLYLELVQPAEIGNLPEGERRVLHQPDGGGFRHDRIGHVPDPFARTNGPAPGKRLRRLRRVSSIAGKHVSITTDRGQCQAENAGCPRRSRVASVKRRR